MADFVNRARRDAGSDLPGTSADDAMPPSVHGIGSLKDCERPGPRPHSGSMPAALMTRPHFRASAFWNCASSSGVEVQASEPVLS